MGDRRCFHCALRIPTRVLFCGLCEPGFEARLTESRVITGKESAALPSAGARLKPEAVAFVVCHPIGLETGSAAQDYIQLYEGDAALLIRSLEHIQSTVTQILGAILCQESAPAHFLAPDFPFIAGEPRAALGFDAAFDCNLSAFLQLSTTNSANSRQRHAVSNSVRTLLRRSW